MEKKKKWLGTKVPLSPKGEMEAVLPAEEEISTGEGTQAQQEVGKTMSEGGKEKQSLQASVDQWLREAVSFFLGLWELVQSSLPQWEEKVPVPQGILEGTFDPQSFARSMALLRRETPVAQEGNTETKGTPAIQTPVSEKAKVMEKLAKWMEQEALAKDIYPKLSLEEEMKDPRFVELLDCGIDVRTAFEIIHKDEIISASMYFAAGEVERRMKEKLPTHGNRPTENGGSRGPAVSKTDVSRMSRKERKELIQRVRMGEVIRL